MNVSELVDNLVQQGVELWVNQDKLGIRSPKGVLTPQLKLELTAHKTKIVDYLQKPKKNCATSQRVSVATIGLLISGFNQNRTGLRSPIVDPQMMAQKLTVTFRPLPKGYQNTTIAKFRSELKDKLRQSKN